jgi:hypothetical protein
MSTPSYLPDAIFWFAVVGAGLAALKHLINPIAAFRELTPIALSGDGKSASAAALWWGSYAFSAMNTGVCTVGVWAGLKQSQVAKQAYLLGTGVLFCAFSLAWFTKGSITAKPNFQFQVSTHKHTLTHSLTHTHTHTHTPYIHTHTHSRCFAVLIHAPIWHV